MAVTIKDLAKETGLGCATISAYLNGVPVRSYNKVKIEEAINKLGYIRNEYARGLKTRKSHTIGILIPELKNIISMTIVGEIEEVLRTKGYGIIVCESRMDISRQQEAMRFLISKMVDGLIVLPVSSDGEDLQSVAENVPMTVICRQTSSDNASHILINNREVSQEAVKRLIDKGRNRIALITDDSQVYMSGERYFGYRQVLEEKGLFDQKMVYGGSSDIDGGYITVKKLLREHPETDGIFVTHYEMFIGCILAMSEMGIKIGEEIDFVGIDTADKSIIFDSALHTIKLPLKEIGENAAEIIVAMIDGEHPRSVLLDAKID